MRVAVVTDSTACLPQTLLSEQAPGSLFIVPLGVCIDGAHFVEGVDIDSDAVARAQLEGRDVTTSRPAPPALIETYARAVRAGAEHVISVHCSGRLSSTVASASLASVAAGVPVTVIDSGTLGMAMGFAALDGAQAAAGGAGPEDVAALVRATAEASVTTFYVDSLEPLRRGGRIGRASALLGSALSIKPLLTVADGVIEPVERVRTTARAMKRLVDRTLTAVHDGDAAHAVLAVHSLSRFELATQVREGLEADVVTGVPAIVDAPLGAVVTAHVGAGTVATVTSFPQNSLLTRAI